MTILVLDNDRFDHFKANNITHHCLAERVVTINGVILKLKTRIVNENRLLILLRLEPFIQLK